MLGATAADGEQDRRGANAGECEQGDDEEVRSPDARHRAAQGRSLMPGAGFLTAEAAGSEDPSACVRKTGVRTDAFAPRRVASSETAWKAMTEGAAGEAARRRANCLDERTAPASADAEPRLGRRSQKLAMFSPTRVRIDTRLRMEESARRAVS